MRMMTGPGRRVVLVGVVLLGLVTVLWWTSDKGPAARGIAASTDCAAQAPWEIGTERPDLAEHLVPVLPVPVGPVRSTLCRYDAEGALIAGLRLDATRTAEVAGWLDALPASAGPATACPAPGPGPVDVVTFGYREDGDATVLVRHGGCVAAGNGILTATAGPELTARFDEFVAVAS
jgi:hypothetical protein